MTTLAATLKKPCDAPNIPAMEGASAVEAIVREHRTALLEFVRRRIGYLVDPEDVLQQAAMRALSRVHQLEDPERARAWFFRILRNVLVDELRAIGVPVRAPVDADDEEDSGVRPPSDDGEACHCALALVGTLKPEYRDILERVVLEDVPVGSVAAELGVTPNNATVRLHRARRALRVLLREHCGTDSLRSRSSCACDERGCRAMPWPSDR